MPWKSNSDLPESVQGLPDEAKSVFRRVANEQLEKGRSEASAMKIAWTAVKSGWRKDEDGDWVRKSDSLADGVDMDFEDRAPIGSFRKTTDGYLVGDARVARTGIQIYKGRDVGRPELDEVRIYRPADSVFEDGALHSFAHRPLTLEHPPEPLTADNWKQYAVGQTGSEIVRDEEGGVQFVRVPMVLMDSEAIRHVEDGTKVELSMGYRTKLLWDAGETPDGEAYDAMQTAIRANHLAVVAAARGGSKLRIGDGNLEGEPLMKVLVDGIPIEMTDQAAAAVDKLVKANAQLTEQLAVKDAAIATTTKTHTDAIAAKDAEIATLKTQVVTGDALDKAIADRAQLIADARRVVGGEIICKGLTNDAIRKAAVEKKLGADACKDQPQQFFDTGFAILLAQAPKDGNRNSVDPLTRVLGDTVTNTSDAEKALAEATKREQDAWRSPAKAA